MVSIIFRFLRIRVLMCVYQLRYPTTTDLNWITKQGRNTRKTELSSSILGVAGNYSVLRILRTRKHRAYAPHWDISEFLAKFTFLLSFVSIILRKTASVRATKADKEQEEFVLAIPSSGFLWKSPNGSTFPSSYLAEVTTECQKVNVACENIQCGTRPAFVSSGGTEGNAPWHVTLFANGKYLCGATLVDEKWAITASSCFKNIE